MRTTVIVALAGDLNTYVGHLGDWWGLVGLILYNGDCLLQLWANCNLLPASINCQHSRRRSTNWDPLHLRPGLRSITWRSANLDVIVRKTGAFLSTYLESDYVRVWATLTLRSSGQQIHSPKRIDVSKLVSAFFESKYETELGSGPAAIPPKTVDEHWLQLNDDMNVESKVAYGLVKFPACKRWVSPGSLQFVVPCRSTPRDHNFDD